MVLTGHLRSFQSNFEKLKHFLLDRFSVDIFISTWDKNYIGPSGTKSISYSVEQINDLVNIYPNVKKVIINNYDMVNENSRTYITSFGPFKPNKDPYYRKYVGAPLTIETMVYNVGQWYAVEKGFDSIDNPEQYSLFFRNRFDIEFLRPIHFKTGSVVMIGPPGAKCPIKHIWKQNCNSRNQLFYGNSNLLMIAKNLYSKYLLAQCTCINLNTDNILEYVFRNNDAEIPIRIDNDFTEYEGFEIKKWF